MVKVQRRYVLMEFLKNPDPALGCPRSEAHERRCPDSGSDGCADQRLDGKEPSSVAWSCAGQGAINQARCVGVSAGKHEWGCHEHRGLD